jgi:hypothetical protein
VAVGGGSAFALAGHNTVASDDIIDGAVHKADIANNAVTKAKIKNAPSGSDAVNADKLDGVSSQELQFGDGFDHARGRVNVSVGGNVTYDLSGGHLQFTCAANPTMVYVDDPGDSFSTDVWSAAGHQTVSDGGTSSGDLTGLSVAPSGQLDVMVYSADVNSAHVGYFSDPGNSNNCIVAFSSQQNGDAG